MVDNPPQNLAELFAVQLRGLPVPLDETALKRDELIHERLSQRFVERWNQLRHESGFYQLRAWLSRSIGFSQLLSHQYACFGQVVFCSALVRVCTDRDIRTLQSFPLQTLADVPRVKSTRGLKMLVETLRYRIRPQSRRTVGLANHVQEPDYLLGGLPTLPWSAVNRRVDGDIDIFGWALAAPTFLGRGLCLSDDAP